MDHLDRIPVIVVLLAVVVGPVAPATAQIGHTDETTDGTNVTETGESPTPTATFAATLDTASDSTDETANDLTETPATDGLTATRTPTPTRTETETAPDTFETESAAYETTDLVDDATDGLTELVDDTVDTVDGTADETAGTMSNTLDETTDAVEGTVDDTGDGVSSTTNESIETVGETTPTVDVSADTVDDAADGTIDSVGRTLDGTSTEAPVGPGATLDDTTDLASPTTDSVADSLRETTDVQTADVQVPDVHATDVHATDVRATGTVDASRKRGGFTSSRGDSPKSGSGRGTGYVDERTGDASQEAVVGDEGPTPVPDGTPAAVGIRRPVDAGGNQARPTLDAGVSDASRRDATLVVAALAAISVVGAAAKSGVLMCTPGTTGSPGTTIRGVARAGVTRVRRIVPLPGYSRHDDSDPLENENRLAIYEDIDGSPGVHSAKLAASTGCSMRTVRYHCRILAEEGLISAEMMNGKKRLYPIDSDGRELQAALTDEARATVLLKVADEEPVTVSRLANAIDRAPSTISHHLTRLEADGLVERTRAGKSVESRLTGHVRRHLEESRPPAETVAEDRREGVTTAGEADD